jgi:hypothetical protein
VSSTPPANPSPVPPPAESAELNCSAQPPPQPLAAPACEAQKCLRTQKTSQFMDAGHCGTSHVACHTSKPPASASASRVSHAPLLGPATAPAASTSWVCTLPVTQRTVCALRTHHISRVPDIVAHALSHVASPCQRLCQRSQPSSTARPSCRPSRSSAAAPACDAKNCLCTQKHTISQTPSLVSRALQQQAPRQRLRGRLLLTVCV